MSVEQPHLKNPCHFFSMKASYSPRTVDAGEIIPQAACKSYGLAIGAYAAPIVRLIIWLEYIIAKPISMVLDWALGEDHGVCHIPFLFYSCLSSDKVSLKG